MAKSSPSLAARAALALVLMIGFYLLALGISGGLLYIPYAEIVYAHRLHIKLAVVCVVGGLMILWSVFPRIDKFRPPGPQLTATQHPRLFQEIQSVARSTSQSMPAEVYLVEDVNAWVAQRGGLMGIGSRRVMGLGLPLMRILTCSQMRAVLAHEFGHYHGGDTALGPWIYKTRGAIGRTVSALSGEDGNVSILQLPFMLYGKMFLRITHAVSRRQEFVADELAARVVGSRPLITGLQTVHGIAPAFHSYWVNECGPVLSAGFRPPLSEGFQDFLRVGRISEIVKQKVEEELQTGKTNPYDTHPPLKERIAAVAALPAGEVGPSDPPAITLLEDVPALENQLLVSLAGPDAAAKLQTIAWADVCARVYLPQWTSLYKVNATLLKGMTPDSLPATAADIRNLARNFVHASGEKPEDAERMAGAVIGTALLLLLLNKGAIADASPGNEITVRLGATQIEPFGVVSSLAKGKLSAEAWQQQCGELGINGVDLSAINVQEAAAPVKSQATSPS